ncbi:MAG TPA: hypothetical protein VFF87_06750 [Hyphomicrobium sp.]|nr:hypothetical protein [Hyphomicrobium sp.]
MVDLQFFLAVGAIGWGLSLAAYRPLARRTGWPLGTAQASLPAVTLSLALACIAVGLALAILRGTAGGGFVIAVFGVALAVFWSGFLRVGAQTSLLLAPLAALALVALWVLWEPIAALF